MASNLPTRGDREPARLAGVLASILDEDEKAAMRKRLCVVSDEVFTFLAETATEVVSRNVINDETGTTDNLWTEEALPAESVLAGVLVAAARGDEKPGDWFGRLGGDARKGRVLQLGGHATVGRGMCRLWTGGRS